MRTSVAKDASLALKAAVAILTLCGGVALLAFGAWFVYTRFLAPEFGIGSGHPLGTLEGIDKSLAKRGLEKSELPPQSVGYSETIYTFCYAGTVTAEGALPELVVVLTSDKSEVLAVGGQWTGAGAPASGTPEAGRFLADYWRAAGAGEPTFEPHRGIAPTAKRAFYAGQKFEGQWIREQDPPDQRMTILLLKRIELPMLYRLFAPSRAGSPTGGDAED
ncbi:MAG: hypothetical protein HY720_23230 [Planctomycetes bacterium]|nr:hypothetical protein [Planctomycetota bacterium]